MPIPRTCVLPGQEYPQHFLEMYQFLHDHQKRLGYPPTITEMVNNGFASSTSVIRYYLTKMQDLGMIKRPPNSRRAITIIPRRQWKRHATPQHNLREYKFTPERKIDYG